MDSVLEYGYEILRGIASILVVTVLINLIHKKSRKKIFRNIEGKLVFIMPKAYGVFGLIGVFAVGMAIFTAPIMELIETPVEFYGAIGLIIVFAGLFASLVLVARNKKVEVDEASIKDTSWLGNKREIMWKDISRVSFGMGSQTLTLRDETTKISLHCHIMGFNQFLAFMKEKLPEEMYAKALEKYQEVLRRMRER